MFGDFLFYANYLTIPRGVNQANQIQDLMPVWALFN